MRLRLFPPYLQLRTDSFPRRVRMLLSIPRSEQNTDKQRGLPKRFLRRACNRRNSNAMRHICIFRHMQLRCLPCHRPQRKPPPVRCRNTRSSAPEHCILRHWDVLRSSNLLKSYIWRMFVRLLPERGAPLFRSLPAFPRLLLRWSIRGVSCACNFLLRDRIQKLHCCLLCRS